MNDDERRSAGMRIRREVLGDAHVDRAIAATTPLTGPFQDLITRTVWGDVWARDGLDRRMRSAVTLGVLLALRAEEELALHVRAALRNGLTQDEVAEVLLHATLYAGMPAGNAAFGVAREVLREVDEAGEAAGADADGGAEEGEAATGW